ncbi:TetR family transcriptional regulator [Pyxidicoccus fallax]|uniref:Helix-turn-helix transcriptional regulator n=1 Tax=Pyxidicoccus fallax TaxID=394095 RepID=A0A848LAC2_9BACT|nr:TetR family transcriptional regulator [Pyxidicoccus fallax]NMO16010.1 helix-turn-helix transcriptional regulator [Pyxidicoccus fallax]NPC85232.1 TetR family transcriptional regulator [Pyxidicoccus fallax]
MVSNTAAKRALPQRARKDEDKEARRRFILDEALKLYESTSYGDVKMADVAERAALAKGTVFLYFPTKEALFLTLLEDLLFAWFAKLEGLLAQDAGEWTGPRMARTVAESLEGEESLTRLLTLLQTVLEQNVTVEQVRRFKERLLEAQLRLGATVEARLPFLRPGEGPRFLVHLHVLVTGLRQMADVAPVTREVLALPHMAPLKVDFTAELTATLVILLRGLEAR